MSNQVHDIQSFLKDGGNIMRRREGRRVVTVAYRCNRDKTVTYAGVIFRKDDPQEEYSKKGHTHTAVQRFYMRPVIIPHPSVVGPAHAIQSAVEHSIRTAMGTVGAYGPRT